MRIAVVDDERPARSELKYLVEQCEPEAEIAEADGSEEFLAMLGQSPVSFKGGGPWAVIEGIEPIFVAVGSSLVVLFFYGFFIDF